MSLVGVHHHIRQESGAVMGARRKCGISDGLYFRAKWPPLLSDERALPHTVDGTTWGGTSPTACLANEDT